MFFSLAVCLQQTVLDVPQLLAQVNIVGLGIVETLNFIPESIHLLQAVTADFIQRRTLVNQLTLNKDGTFSGEYHETLVDQTEDGAFTLISLCNFEGYFKAIEKIDDFTYRLTIGEYKTELGLGDEWVENGIFYQSAEPFGISNCQEFMLYLPGKITGALPDSFLMWVNHKIYNGKLQTYALHNTANGFGFVEAD